MAVPASKEELNTWTNAAVKALVSAYLSGPEHPGISVGAAVAASLVLLVCLDVAAIRMGWKFRMEGALEKLEGHRGGSPRKSITRRWTMKWVTCDGATLSYYVYKPPAAAAVAPPSPGSPPTSPIQEDDEPRKTLAIGKCKITEAKADLQINVAGNFEVGGPYDITFRCADEKDFAAWVKYLASVGEGSTYAWLRSRSFKYYFVRLLLVLCGVAAAAWGHAHPETLQSAHGMLQSQLARPRTTTTTTTTTTTESPFPSKAGQSKGSAASAEAEPHPRAVWLGP